MPPRGFRVLRHASASHCGSLAGGREYSERVAPHEMLRVFCPDDAFGALCMHGRTSAYAVDPIGQCVFGVILAGEMEAQRGRERHVFRVGDLCLWDPSAPHSGRPHRGADWEARLILLDLSRVESLLLDPDRRMRSGRIFADPRRTDRRLAQRFVAMHRDLELPSSALEREATLMEWLLELTGQPVSASADRDADRRRAHRDPALRRARELLDDDPAANVSLSRLAEVAGIDRHRLTRLFRAAHGVPPHRFQLARRLRLARTLLEQGQSIAMAAVQAGFVDQSHLHRHFRGAFGVTPARYAALVRSDVQDRPLPEP